MAISETVDLVAQYLLIMITEPSLCAKLNTYTGHVWNLGNFVVRRGGHRSLSSSKCSGSHVGSMRTDAEIPVFGHTTRLISTPQTATGDNREATLEARAAGCECAVPADAIVYASVWCVFVPIVCAAVFRRRR